MAARKRAQRMSQGIKPPPVPAGEDPYVTMANMENQMDLLIKRVEVLDRENTEIRSDYQRMADVSQGMKAELDAVRSEVDYNSGYIARVKEEDKHRYGDLKGE